MYREANTDTVPNSTNFRNAKASLCAGGKEHLRIGYARVSTDEQSLNLQIDALRAAGVTRVFTDKLSGKSRKRPGLAKALAAVKASDTIVVWRLDRIGRHYRDLVDIADELRERGANLVSLTEGIDTASNVGEVIYRLMIVFADFERTVIVERTVAGLASAKARGITLGRRPALSAVEVKEACRLVQAGESVRKVASRLRVGRSTLYNYLTKARERCTSDAAGSASLPE